MYEQGAKRSMRAIALCALLATLGLAIFSAQPWGGNDAYAGASAYLPLTKFLAWATAPCVYLLISAGRLARQCANRFYPLAFVLAVCIGGSAAIVDTVFIHIDAQGALIFLFLPIVQWCVIVAFELAQWLARHLGRRPADSQASTPRYDYELKMSRNNQTSDVGTR
jgi:hypothetical protein